MFLFFKRTVTRERMIKISHAVLKVTVISVFVGISIVYFTNSDQTSKMGNCVCEEIAEIADNNGSGRTREISERKNAFEGDRASENDYCRELLSNGVITKSKRKVRPGLLKDVSEGVVADDSIFFLETSCAEDLNSRQSCAVESAAKANPDKQVYVLLISPEAKEGSEEKHNIGKLKSTYGNINFYFIDIVNYSKGTIMEKWIEKQTLRNSSYKVSHLSDGLRFLTLFRYGGIYLDMDVVVMHSLKNMKNFAGYESEKSIACGVIGMKANGTLVKTCLDEFVNNFRGDLWGHNGPEVVTRALSKKCKRKTRNLWVNCDGNFIIYPERIFYPIYWKQWKLYFEKSNDHKMVEIVNKSTAVHVWNSLSSKKLVKVGSNILYGVLANNYCPVSYWSSAPFF